MAPQQIGRGAAGTDQQNAVHPVTYQKVEQGGGFAAPYPAAAQHDLVVLFLGVALQVQHDGGVKRAGELRQNDAQHTGPAGD